MPYHGRRLEPWKPIIKHALLNTTPIPLALTGAAEAQSFAFSSKTISRKLSSLAESQSYSNTNDKIARAMYSREISQSSSYTNEAIIKSFSSLAFCSQSLAIGNEKILKALSSQEVSQSQSYSYESSSKGLSASAFRTQSFATGGEVIQRLLLAKNVSCSQSTAQESIQRLLSSIEAISQSYSFLILVNFQVLPPGAVSQSYAYGSLYYVPSTIHVSGSAISDSFAVGTNDYYGTKFVELTRAAPVSEENVINVGPIDILDVGETIEIG